MQAKERFFYGRDDKLKSRKVIEKLFKTGKSFSNFPFKVFWLPENSGSVLQTGVGVSSRYFKKATDRNRIKRLIRESYRLQKNELTNYLISTNQHCSLFILFTGKEIPSYQVVYDKTAIILKRLIKILNEKISSDS